MLVVPTTLAYRCPGHLQHLPRPVNCPCVDQLNFPVMATICQANYNVYPLVAFLETRFSPFKNLVAYHPLVVTWRQLLPHFIMDSWARLCLNGLGVKSLVLDIQIYSDISRKKNHHAVKIYSASAKGLFFLG